jgi:RNA polymerase sigma-70 factor (ECF subfamily)
LLAQVAAGDESAFVALYRRRRDDVYRFAVALARSAAVAEDVTQEVFLNALENAARYDVAKGSVRAWLIGCARHTVLDRMRLERRWTDEIPECEAPDDHVEGLFAEQRLDRLHAAIARLPLEYREAIVLCELAELSYAESAAVLECPIGTVRSRLHRARRQLAVMLKDCDEAAAAGVGGAAARVLAAGEVGS